MPTIEAKVPEAMKQKLDMLAEVDDMSRGEVIRIALREYLDDIDWKSVHKDLDEKADEESDELDEDESESDDED